jgi:hypothetical protein
MSRSMKCSSVKGNADIRTPVGFVGEMRNEGKKNWFDTVEKIRS